MPKTPKVSSSESLQKQQPPTDTVAADQSERGYYYDDAYGYEAFDPSADEPEDEVEDEK